jgi:hypothetical protein
MTFTQELKYAIRSLSRAKGLALTVIATLALGIGVNAAIFSLVRSVLLRPLVNRDEARILYIRQSAPGIRSENSTFSVPEIQDIRDRVRSLSDVAEFSTLGFTMVGLGEPRTVRAGVVSGNYFDVMGLKPVLGRLLTAHDDGPSAAGAAVLTYNVLEHRAQSRPHGAGQNHSAGITNRHDRRRPGTIGALSGRNRGDRQRGDQPAPSVSDDGHRPRAPDDGSVRPADAAGDGRSGAHRTGRRLRNHQARITARPIRRAPDSPCGRFRCAISSPPMRAPC